MFRRRHRPASTDPKRGEESATPIVKLVNRFAGLSQIFEPCRCGIGFNDPAPSPPFEIHADWQDTTCEAWQRLLELIDDTADAGLEEFTPGVHMPKEMWRQIVTLPPSIAKLGAVRNFTLYGSNLIAIPPEIGEMTSLEDFRPYTSRRLHWFPYEITRCPALRDSTVSTRNTYGNFHYRMPFPALPADVPNGSTPRSCSVCNAPAPSAGFTQVWISLAVGTDVLPLLVHACSEDCVRALPTPPEGYLDRPHQGGPAVVQPEAYFRSS
jgi:hypothetical protein